MVASMPGRAAGSQSSVNAAFHGLLFRAASRAGRARTEIPSKPHSSRACDLRIKRELVDETPAGVRFRGPARREVSMREPKTFGSSHHMVG
jgi:hypothetical protein